MSAARRAAFFPILPVPFLRLVSRLEALAATAVLAAVAAPLAVQDPWAAVRERMVERQVAARDVRDSATLAALRSVPRHEFVPDRYRNAAYDDRPLPIGLGQTISQPYIVGYMTERLRLEPSDRVLEVGTGSGYQAAVLAEIVDSVYTIEIFGELARAAETRLGRLGYGNVRVRHADGFYGWPQAAPFDAVIVTAAAGHIPPSLVEQLRPGGRMMIPVGSVHGVQTLILVQKAEDGTVATESLLPVRFVPLLRGER
ncbi:MAG: protein-L-isoaspartate(D-aspartate) O-methyltransferase [Gemmatimonadota bacterium]